MARKTAGKPSKKLKPIEVTKTSMKILVGHKLKDVYVDNKGNGYAIDTAKVKRKQRRKRILGIVFLCLIIYAIWQTCGTI